MWHVWEEEHGVGVFGGDVCRKYKVYMGVYT
jgi:hypothetical protein